MRPRFPCVTGAGAEVDHMIRCGDHAHVELDRDDGVTCLDERLKVGDETICIRAMKPGGRLIEHVQGVAALSALQLARVSRTSQAQRTCRWLRRAPRVS